MATLDLVSAGETNWATQQNANLTALNTELIATTAKANAAQVAADLDDDTAALAADSESALRAELNAAIVEVGSENFVPYKLRARNKLTGRLHVDAYGAVFDGTMHPLSEFFGTLSEAQAAYPDVTIAALTESVDRVAIQQAMEDALGSSFERGWAIELPWGIGVVDDPVIHRHGVTAYGYATSGYFPAVNFTDTQEVGTTIKLKDGTRTDVWVSDPDAPDAPYIQTPQEKWQRSALIDVRLDGNRKNNYGPTATETAILRIEGCWNFYLKDVYVYSGGGYGIYLADTNVVNGDNVIAYSCNNADIYVKDSADGTFTGGQYGGARGSSLVLDGSLGMVFNGGIFFNSEAGAGVLSADISDTQTAGITINGTATSNTLTLELDRVPHYKLRIGSEVITYTGFTGTTAARVLTGVTRGADGTTAVAHTTGDRVDEVSDGILAGIALINGSTANTVSGRADQTGGAGVYIDETSEGNNVDVTQYWAGWGAAADAPGFDVLGKGNRVDGASWKRDTGGGKEHQTVGVRVRANATDNLITVVTDRDFSPQVQFDSDYARYTNTVLRGRGDIGALSSEAQALVSGRYITTGSATDTATLSANMEYALPILIQSRGSLDTVAIEVTGAGDGSAVLRLGLRNDLGTGVYPGALVADLGTVGAATTGVKTKAISQTLTPGLYWLTVTAQGAASAQPTVRVSRRQRARVLSNTASGAVGGGAYSYTQSAVLGALPGAFNSSVNVSAIDPVIALRAL